MSEFLFFFRLNNIPLFILLFIHSSVKEHLGCLYLLTIVNNAAIYMGVQIFLQDPAFNSFWYILRSGISGSHGNSMFDFLRNCHDVFHSSCTFLHLHSSAQRFQILYTLASVFLGSDHSNGCEVIISLWF